MIKAVIFDMDGVIIDSEPIHKVVEESVFEKIGANVSKEEHNSYVGMTSKGMWSEIKEKHELIKDFTIEELIEMEVKSYIEHILSYEDIEPINGVVGLIDELYKKDIKLALASSAVRKSVDTVVEMFELGKYFKTSVSGDEVKDGKPAPDIFLKAAKALKVDPKNCVVFEDSKNGVHAAKKAGMKCIGFKNMNSGDQDLSFADTIISSYSEISYKKLYNLFELNESFA